MDSPRESTEVHGQLRVRRAELRLVQLVSLSIHGGGDHDGLVDFEADECLLVDGTPPAGRQEAGALPIPHHEAEGYLSTRGSGAI